MRYLDIQKLLLDYLFIFPSEVFFQLAVKASSICKGVTILKSNFNARSIFPYMAFNSETE